MKSTAIADVSEKNNHSLAQMNEKACSFWKMQSELLSQRITDPDLWQFALKEIEFEELGTPVRHRKSLEQLLSSAALLKDQCVQQARRGFNIEFARKGGKASKADPLTNLIYTSLRRNPRLSVAQLLNIVEKTHGFEISDGYVWYACNNGREKQAPVLALKHRLSRAKKKLQSR